MTETVVGVQRHLDALMKESLSKYRDAVVAGAGGDGYTKWYGRIEHIDTLEVFGEETPIPKLFTGDKCWIIKAWIEEIDYAIHLDILRMIDNYGNRYEARIRVYRDTAPQGLTHAKCVREEDDFYDMFIENLPLDTEEYDKCDEYQYSIPLSNKTIDIIKDSEPYRYHQVVPLLSHNANILRKTIREMEAASKLKDARILELEAELKAARTPPTVDMLGILDAPVPAPTPPTTPPPADLLDLFSAAPPPPPQDKTAEDPIA